MNLRPLLLIPMLTAPAMADSVVVFNEIHYHPDTSESAREYIELHNQMSVDVDLSGWSITGGVNYVFPAGTRIPGRGYVVVAANPAGVQAAYGTYGTFGVLGPWAGRLSNSGEDLHLRDNNDREMDEVVYGTDGKWPTGADGAGPSLTKLSPTAASGEAASWTTSWQQGGTPGAANFVAPGAPFIPPSGLISWWRMEEATGATTVDQVGANTGTLGAGATRVAGLTGAGAISFNNTSGASVNVGSSTSLGVTSGITIEAVIKPTWNGTGTDTIFGRNNLVIPANLAAWYSFDEASTGTTAAIDVAGGTNGTLLGSSTRIQGASGSIGAVQCNNAAGDGVNIGTALSFTTGLTISMWIKPTWSGNFGDYDQLLRKEDGGSRILFCFQNDSNNGGASPPVPAGPVLSLGLNTGGYKEMDMPLDGASGRPTLAQLKDGNWHHVAATYDGVTGTKSIYVDGTLRFTTTHSGNIVSGGGAAAVIGNSGVGGGEPFSGGIDGCALFRVALTGPQIANLANDVNTPLNVLPGSSQPSKVVLAFQNDGQNNSAIPPVSPGPVLSFGLNTGGVYSELDMPLDGNSGRPTVAQLTDGADHYIAASYDSITGVKSLFIDGTLRYSTTLTGPISAAGTAPAVIGNLAPGGSDAFTGVIDEVAYWGKSLSALEVAEHWAKTQQGADYLAALFPYTAPPMLRISEVGAPGSFFVELQNTGSTALDLTGVIVKSTGLGGGQYVFPAQSLAPGAMVSLNAAQLGFSSTAGAKLFVLAAGSSQMADSVEIETGGMGRTSMGAWAVTSSSTPGAANAFSLHDEIVISELMYHPRSIPAVSAVVQDSTLVPLTATWKYRDDAVDLGAAWKAPGYSDAAWSSGQGMLGSFVASDAYAAAVAADSPVAYWKLDDASLSIADASGNGRNGTASGGVVLGVAPLVPDGATSKAIQLAGSHRVLVPGFEKIGPGGYSVEYWVKVVTPPTSFVNLIGDGESGGDFFMMNYLTPNMNIRPHYGVGNTPVSLDSTGALSVGQVFHVVTTWDTLGSSNNGVIYINGVPDRTGTITQNLPTAGNAGNNIVFIGHDNREAASGSYIIDEVALYDHPLSAARVAAHYTIGARPQPRNTTVATGPATHYFRTSFNYTGNPANTQLLLDLAADDGAVVYLNGVEIRRDNLPLGAVAFGTGTTMQRNGVSLSGPLVVPALALQTGSNVLAVEVHQFSGGDPDVFLGLELTARETLTPAVPMQDSPNSWLELTNKSAQSVDLAGWKLDGGADYVFPSGAAIPAGGRLVVAHDLTAFAVAHPAVTALGPLTNPLSRSTARVMLRDAAGNIADEVTYYDDGRWPSAADGGGSSLELRDARSDNSAAESWAASDESNRGVWQTYTYRSIAAADGGPTTWSEFVLGLLEEGEVLIDDIHVISEPDTVNAAEVVAGGNFESGITGWRVLGTHRTSEVIAEPGNASNHALRLISTGGTDVMHNHVETTLVGNAPIVNGREYEISFRAKWQRGGDLLNTRLYWNRCARVTRVAVPDGGGTPGAVNSRAVANAGPTFAGMRHFPVVPAVAEACVVSVEAVDPDNVASATLFYAVNGAAWQSVSMTASGSSWSAAIPGQAAGAMVQFYVRATDGAAATADFPASGAASRAMVQWNDAQANLPLAHNLRLLLPSADVALLFTNTNLLADDGMPCTVIYDESEIFYNVRVRLKGSEHGRTDAGRQSYNLRFSPDQKFRGLHESVLVDRSGGWRFGRTMGQDEILVKHIISQAGGVASLHDDMIRLISPQAGHTGPALLQMARYGSDYLDSMYKDGSAGAMHKMEIAYHQTGTVDGQPTGLKQAQEGAVSNVDLGDRGADKESYRWFFQKENHTEDDDFSSMMALNAAFSKSGAAFDAAVDPLIDNDQWMCTMALESLCGIADIFSRDNGHNVMFYQRPKDGKLLLLPWDWDFSFVQATNAPLWGTRAVSKLIQRPHNLRRFYCHLQDMMATTFNTTSLAYWTDHYDNFAPGQDFSSILTWIGQRSAYVQSQIPPPSPWAVTVAPAANAFIGTGLVNFAGTAPFGYKTVSFTVGSCPAVEGTFTTLGDWQAVVPIALGRNVISLSVRDVNDNIIAGASQEFVVIGSDPNAFEDADLDGLPDVWECLTGLDLFPNATAAGDADGDGRSNYAEYLDGTDPRSGSSFALLTPPLREPGGRRFQLPVKAGRTYRLEASDTLGAGSWSTLHTVSPQPVDGNVEFLDNTAEGQRKFYRLTTP